MKHFPPISAEEEKRLALAYQTTGDAAALRRLVESHLGMVINIARKFHYSGEALDDLIQEGCVGLVFAAKKFDPTKSRLFTYGPYWIRACIIAHVVKTHGPVRIGASHPSRKVFFGIRRARRTLEHAGHVATPEALANLIGVNVDVVRDMIPRLENLDVEIDAFNGSRTLPDHTASPEEQVAEHEEDTVRRALLRKALRKLDERERVIIRERHMGQGAATLLDLGGKFGISRERVRQLELRALAKIRASVGAGS